MYSQGISQYKICNKKHHTIYPEMSMFLLFLLERQLSTFRHSVVLTVIKNHNHNHNNVKQFVFVGIYGVVLIIPKKGILTLVKGGAGVIWCGDI